MVEWTKQRRRFNESNELGTTALIMASYFPQLVATIFGTDFTTGSTSFFRTNSQNPCLLKNDDVFIMISWIENQNSDFQFICCFFGGVQIYLSPRNQVMERFVIN